MLHIHVAREGDNVATRIDLDRAGLLAEGQPGFAQTLGPASMIIPKLGTYRGPMPYDVPSSMAVVNGLLQGTGVTAGDVITGRRWPGTSLGAGGPIILAQTGAGTMNGVPLFAPPIRQPWARPGMPGAGPAGVAGAALAAALLAKIDDRDTRAKVEAALTQFRLDRNNPNDVKGAYAYVWAQRYAKRLFPRLPWTDAAVEDAAQAVMQYERRNPGLVDAVIQGDFAAQQTMNTLLEDFMFPPITIHERRESKVDDKLSTDSDYARSLVGTQTMQVWQAHHLIPFATIALLPEDVQKAIVKSGWVLDSTENLIALPANYATFLGAPNVQRRPYHLGPHPMYNADVSLALVGLQLMVARGMAGPPILAYLRQIEQRQTTRIFQGYYHDRVS